MKRHTYLLVILLLGSGMSEWTSEYARGDEVGDGGRLRYTVALTDPASQTVRVTVQLTDREMEGGMSRWALPQGFAFVRLPEPVIAESITATVDGEVSELERTGPYEWEIAAPGVKEIRLVYTVPQTHRMLEAVKQRDAYEYPYLAADHGMLVSPTLFLYPTNVEIGAIRVDFELPEGWEVLAPWESTGQRSFQPRNLQELVHDLIAVGAWHKHETRIGDFEAIVAVAPGQEALEKSVFEPIEKIVEAELKVFDREPRGRYLFLFGRPDTSGMAGSPKTNSMTLSVEPRLAPVVGSHIGHLIAHEFFHTWTAGQEIPDELRWYNEGFTDYFAYLIPARLGSNMRQSFSETLGEKMTSCADNPRRGKTSLVDAGGRLFFSDRDAYNLTYDGGLLLAAWLDQAIRKHDSGRELDDLMRAFNNDSRWAKQGNKPTLADFLARVGEFAGESIARRFEQYVKQPFAFDPIVAFGDLGIEIRCEEKPAELSLRANLDGTRLIDIDPKCAAYLVGLRADDRVIKLNGQEVGDASALRKAWREPQNGRIQVLLRRGEQEISIDEVIPNERKFIVPSEPWR